MDPESSVPLEQEGSEAIKPESRCAIVMVPVVAAKQSTIAFSAVRRRVR